MKPNTDVLTWAAKGLLLDGQVKEDDQVGVQIFDSLSQPGCKTLYVYMNGHTILRITGIEEDNLII